MVEIVPVYLTFPVNLVVADNLLTGFNPCQVALPTGTVLIEQQFRGSCLAHSLKYLPESVATCKKQQQHGNIGLGGILHFFTFSLQRYKKLLTHNP